MATSGNALIDSTTTKVLLSQTRTAINPNANAAFDFALTDEGCLVKCTSAVAVTATVRLNATVAFPVGAQIDVVQYGAGKVTIAAEGGVTINSKGGNKACGAQYVAVSLFKIAADEWLLLGDLIA